MLKKHLDTLEKYTRDTNEYMGQKSRSVLAQYPLIFSFLVIFGSIASLKGFEAIIVGIWPFNEHPSLLLLLGILTLLFTGSLFKFLRSHQKDVN